MGAVYQRFLQRERQRRLAEVEAEKARLKAEQDAARISQAELSVESLVRQGGPRTTLAKDTELWKSSVIIAWYQMQWSAEYQERLRTSAPDSHFARQHADFLALREDLHRWTQND